MIEVRKQVMSYLWKRIPGRRNSPGKASVTGTVVIMETIVRDEVRWEGGCRSPRAGVPNSQAMDWNWSCGLLGTKLHSRR